MFRELPCGCSLDDATYSTVCLVGQFADGPKQVRYQRHEQIDGGAPFIRMNPGAQIVVRLRTSDKTPEAAPLAMPPPSGLLVGDPNDPVDHEHALVLQASYDGGRSWRPVMRLDGPTQWRITTE
jgi:hypothetical protein